MVLILVETFKILIGRKEATVGEVLFGPEWYLQSEHQVARRSFNKTDNLSQNDLTDLTFATYRPDESPPLFSDQRITHFVECGIWTCSYHHVAFGVAPSLEKSIPAINGREATKLSTAAAHGAKVQPQLTCRLASSVDSQITLQGGPRTTAAEGWVSFQGAVHVVPSLAEDFAQVIGYAAQLSDLVVGRT